MVSIELTLEELQTIERALDDLFIEEPWSALISSYDKIQKAINQIENK